MELKLSSPQDCIGDSTYNFIWQHKGAKLNPTDAIPSQSGTNYTYEMVVEALKSGEDVQIKGDVGTRVGSSLGVDLVYFGGTGMEQPEVGSIIVDGNTGSHLGLSMLSGAIYVKGEVKEPLGNVVQVTSDRAGYKKFVSITWLLHHPEERHGLCTPNAFKNGELQLTDGIIRNTLAARCMKDAKVHVKGDVGISVGILMRKGTVIVDGDAGMNAAALLNGGEVVLLGDAAEFLGVEQMKGRVFVKGNCKGFVGAKMTGGRIICRRTKPIPPVIERKLEPDDLALLAQFGISGMLALTYARYDV
ncbi:formylmethanofuran dehydrogenase subunit C [Methanophagales archaeon]|nr:formylmethanofuran dehydrogenase subunit C [Methanophagales archaeon]